MHTNETPVLKGQATPEQLAEWKAKYKKGFYAIQNEDIIGYFRNPGLAEMNYAATKLTAEAPMDYNKYILQATAIGGATDELIEDEDSFIGATILLKEKLEGKKAKLVNF